MNQLVSKYRNDLVALLANPPDDPRFRRQQTAVWAGVAWLLLKVYRMSSMIPSFSTPTLASFRGCYGYSVYIHVIYLLPI